MIKDVEKNDLPMIIANHPKGAIFYYSQDKKHILKQRATHYIKKLASLFFIDIQKYYEFVNKYIGIKYKIPLVFSDKTIFIRTKNEKNFDHVWINYAMIKTVIYNKQTLNIVFENGFEFEVDMSIKDLNNQFQKIKTISSFIMKDKHQMFNEIHIKK